MNKNAERAHSCLTMRRILKLVDKNPIISFTAFESKYKGSKALTEKSSRFNPFKILMRRDLSTLLNPLEKSNLIAHEHRLAKRSGIIFSIAVCIFLPGKDTCG